MSLSAEVNMRSAIDILRDLEDQHCQRLAEQAAVRKKANGERLGRPVSLPEEVRDRIVRDRAIGMTLSAIARNLTADEVPTARGGHWHPATVRAVLASVALDDEPTMTAARKKPRKLVECIYCEGEVPTSKAERDHFPMPQRYGGTEVVWACKECHNLKDRWSLIVDAYEAAASRMEQDLGVMWILAQTVSGLAGTTDNVPPHWPWDESPADIWVSIKDRLDHRMERVFVARLLAGRHSEAWDHYLEQQKWTEKPSWW